MRNQQLVCLVPTCRTKGCYKHCNNCLKDIVWRHPNLDKEIQVKVKRALNPDGSVHFCMTAGVKRYERNHKKYFFNDPVLDAIDYNRDLYDYLVKVGVAH